MKVFRIFVLIVFLFANFVAYSNPPLIAPTFNNLGTFHFPISVKNPTAQQFFDQGLVLYYGFEWGESIRSFEEAARLEPNCAMCYWGMALGLGSKINAPISGHEYADAKSAIQKALSLQKYATPAERAYIQALSRRFQHRPKKIAAKGAGSFSCHVSHKIVDASTKNEIADYALAMHKVMAKYRDDNNAKALYAFALFDTISWDFWDANGHINPLTPVIIAVLEAILNKEPSHIGGNHYYIHVMEQSPSPEAALKSAHRLKSLVPGSEHLVHMPVHIYFLTGRYHEATESNLQAIEAFKKYNETCEKQGFSPAINYLYFHNYDFLRTTAIMEGRKNLALDAGRELLSPPFAEWLAHDATLQWFIPIPYFIKARFGLWDEILKEEKPQPSYGYALGMWHYAQGLAFVKTDNTKAANEEALALDKIIQKGPRDENLQKNGVHLLKIAQAILKAAIADQNNDEKATIRYLKVADKIQHDMGYHEPPDWYFPVKEALGDAYLKWHHPKEAIAMYSADLKQYPQNGWALRGLANALKAAGKMKEAQDIEKEFKIAWQYAD